MSLLKFLNKTKFVHYIVFSVVILLTTYGGYRKHNSGKSVPSFYTHTRRDLDTHAKRNLDKTKTKIKTKIKVTHPISQKNRYRKSAKNKKIISAKYNKRNKYIKSIKTIGIWIFVGFCLSLFINISLTQQNEQNKKLNQANKTTQDLRSELIKEKKQLRNVKESLAQMYRVFNNMVKEKHENVNPMEREEQWTFAIRATDFSEISLILSTGDRHTILNEDSENGRTALHYAVDAGHLPLTKYLVESVQNDKKFLNKKDKKGLTAVTIAFQNSDYRTLLFLHKVGATVPFNFNKIKIPDLLYT